MTGSSPYPPGFGAPPPGSGPSVWTKRTWLPFRGCLQGGSSELGRARKRTGLLAAGVILAVLLGVAALVVAIVSAAHGNEPSPPPPVPHAEAQQLLVDDADKPLCEAVGPLMKDSDDVTNAFIAKGDPGSPERRAAIPQFKADTLDLADRIQKVINEHADPPRYLTRTLQSYVDGMLLYSENMYTGSWRRSFVTRATYDASVVAYGGPLGPVTNWAFVGSRQGLAMSSRIELSRRSSFSGVWPIRRWAHGVEPRRYSRTFAAASSGWCIHE